MHHPITENKFYDSFGPMQLTISGHVLLSFRWSENQNFITGDAAPGTNSSIMLHNSIKSILLLWTLTFLCKAGNCMCWSNLVAFFWTDFILSTRHCLNGFHICDIISLIQPNKSIHWDASCNNSKHCIGFLYPSQNMFLEVQHGV